ncbi:MAG: hypothetical protein IJO76_03355 [Clostridia bacterium]|nr:hypothetical protein [Clostridia bacterium]
MKRIICIGLAAVLLLLCTGCSLDVESFLQPPRSRGEQRQVQQALETYIRDSGIAERYTLKFPTEGEYTSAFVLCDGQGRPLTDDSAEARMAVAFYALSSAPEETHINLLRKDGEDWISVADGDGSGADIRQVTFGDLNGDGMAELLTGWSTYNSLDRRLAVYDVHNGLTLLTDDRLYTSLYVGDMLASGEERLLLLRVGSNNRVTASLEQLSDKQLVTVDTVRLDGQIQRFEGMTLCRLTGEVHGLYVDGIRRDNTLVTELIYYDDTGLHAPFYNADTNATAVTHRSNGLAARDVDGDGNVDVPRSHRLSDRSDADLTGYVTVWNSWEYESLSWEERLQTVINTAEDYMVVLDETQRAGLTTRYDPLTHTLDLLGEEGQVWLRLYTGDGETLPDPLPAELETVSLLPDERGKDTCMAWFDPQVLETEKVRYMVFRLTA